MGQVKIIVTRGGMVVEEQLASCLASAKLFRAMWLASNPDDTVSFVL